MHSFLYICLCALSVVYSAVIPRDRDRASTAAPRQLSSRDSASFAYSNTPKVKAINTSLSMAIALGTVATYVFLVKNGKSLATGLVFPRSSVQRRVSALLSEFWPAQLGFQEERRLATNNTSQFHRGLRRLHLALSSSEPFPRETAPPAVFIAGHQDLIRQPYNVLALLDSPKFWFHPVSQVMKNITQLAIWEFWSLWLTVAMVVLTVTYNGFLYNEPGPDSWFRLGLVIVYALLNLLHIYQSMRYIGKILDSVGTQACWCLISRKWLFADYYSNLDWTYDGTPRIWRSFECEILGPTKIEGVFKSIPAEGSLSKQEREGARSAMKEMSMGGHERVGTYCIEEDTTSERVKTAEEHITLLIDNEVRSLEKAAESGLEKIFANVGVLLGICLTTGLSPLTTVRSGDSTAAQIGSYALLLALSTGAATLVASLSQLSNAVVSATTLLRFQSHMFSMTSFQHESALDVIKAHNDQAAMVSDAEGVMITLRDLVSCIKGWKRALVPFMGPAVSLVPTSETSTQVLKVQVSGDVYEIFETWSFHSFNGVCRYGLQPASKDQPRTGSVSSQQQSASEEGENGIELTETRSSSSGQHLDDAEHDGS